MKSSSNYLTIFPSNGNLWKSFWATMPLLESPYRNGFGKSFISSLFILNQNIRAWQEFEISDSPARKCVFWSLPLEVAIIWQGRFLSRISYYLSLYVFLLRCRSFAMRKVHHFSRNTLMSIAGIWSNLCFLSWMYRIIPPFDRSATTWFKCSLFIERRRFYLCIWYSSKA